MICSFYIQRAQQLFSEFSRTRVKSADDAQVCLYILSEGVHECVDHDEDEGDDEIEDEPGVDHLDV